MIHYYQNFSVENLEKLLIPYATEIEGLNKC
jgi:hypothetical protein